MDNESLSEVTRYLTRHFRRLSIETGHALAGSPLGFKLRGDVNGELYIADSFFNEYPAPRVFDALDLLRVADALRSAAGRRRVVVTASAVRSETYVPRQKRRSRE